MRAVRIRGAVGVAVLSLLLAGCSAGNAAAPSASASPVTLRFGVPPDEADPAWSEHMRPVADQIAKATGTTVELLRTSDYLTIIAALRAKKLDIAIIGPMPTVIAERDGGVEPLVTVQGAPVRATIICSPRSGVRTLAQIKGHSIAFVDPGSTSGNYIPRLLLERAGVDVASLKVTYAGGHDAAVLSVKQGSTDCAANSSLLLPLMVKSHTISTSDYRIIAQSDPLPINSVVLARSGLSSALKTKIADVLLSTQSPALLANNHATKIVSAADTDWSTFQAAARELNLLLEKLQ